VQFSPTAFGRPVVARRSGNYIVFQDEDGNPLKFQEAQGKMTRLRAKLVDNGHGVAIDEEAFYTLGSPSPDRSDESRGSFKYKISSLKRFLARSDRPADEVAMDRKVKAWNRASIGGEW
jgi:hypothetical protein